MAYLLSYDSEYGRFGKNVTADDSNLYIEDRSIALFNEPNIEDVPWSSLDVDIIIDASGVHRNVLAAPKLLKKDIRKVLITHSPDEVDNTIILGVNEASYNPDEHNVISSSICDSVAFAPVV